MSNGGSARSSSSTFHFAAGLGSGLLSAVLLQPCDLLKTRIQQQSRSNLRTVLASIAQTPHPLRELWRGTVPSALRTGLGSALYFSALNTLRQTVARSNARALAAPAGTSTPLDSHATTTHSSSLPRLSNTANLLTGALARAVAGLAISPATVVKVRWESELYAYSSLAGAARAIAATEGLRGFFVGFGATAMRDAPYAGLYVLFYEQGKRRLSVLREGLGGDSGMDKSTNAMTVSTSTTINFVSGVVAAGLATAITNPFDVIKTRLQLMPGRYGNMLVAARMLREEGVRSLFDGLALRMARKAASSALAWSLYEEFIRRAERKFVL